MSLTCQRRFKFKRWEVNALFKMYKPYLGQRRPIGK
jgi:hypothetical protein